MTDRVYPTRRVDDLGEVKVESDEYTLLIMQHASGTLSHVDTGFGYFVNEHLPKSRGALYTVDVMGTRGGMHLQGWDWGPAGVDVATLDLTELETHCTEEWKYEWVGGAAYTVGCLLAGRATACSPAGAKSGGC